MWILLSTKRTSSSSNLTIYFVVKIPWHKRNLKSATGCCQQSEDKKPFGISTFRHSEMCSERWASMLEVEKILSEYWVTYSDNCCYGGKIQNMDKKLNTILREKNYFFCKKQKVSTGRIETYSKGVPCVLNKKLFCFALGLSINCD